MTRALGFALSVLLLGSTAGCTRQAPAEHTPANLLLVTVDTLRADHLGFAGYPRDTSPNLDVLTREGVWFPSFYSQSATTGAAHASLFTSLPQREHGVTANSQPFPTDVASLISALRENGYYATAFVSSVVDGRKSKLQRHFDHFDDHLTTVEPNREMRFERPAQQTVGAALDHLGQMPVGEPRGPYGAPVDPDRYVGDAYYGKIKKQIPIGDTDWEHYEIPRYQALDGRTDAAYYLARYDAEIRYTDSALGALFEEIKKRGLYQNTLIAVTADHGETLAEDGHLRYFSHGMIAYEEVVRIPLVVREPRGDRRLGSIARERPLSSLDLAPTLLALLGVPAPESFQGRNLLATELAPEAPIFSLGGYGTANLEKSIGTQFSERRGPLRYILNSKDGTEELYDHRSDTRETRNLMAEPPVNVAALRAGIDETVGAHHAAAPAPALSEDQAAALKALGYVE